MTSFVGPRLSIRPRPWLSGSAALLTAVAVLGGVSLLDAQTAWARGYRAQGHAHGSYGRGGGSGGMRQMQHRQAPGMQQQAMQKKLAMKQKLIAECKALRARFDTNHDGKIDGQERVALEKYLRENKGNNPCAQLKKLGQGKLANKPPQAKLAKKKQQP